MENKKVSLLDLAKTFLLIGTIGFGGGMAIIALTQDYCVNKKKWMDVDEFAHGVALGQLWGAFAVNISIFVGCRLRGIKGGLVSLFAFLMPSILFVILLSALYLHFQSVPSLQSAMMGIGPIVTALVLYAAFQTGKGRLKNLEAILLIVLTVFLFTVLKLQVALILLLALIYGFVKTKVTEAKINEDF